MCLKIYVILLEYCICYIYEIFMYIGYSLSKFMLEIKFKKYLYVILKYLYILEMFMIYY